MEINSSTAITLRPFRPSDVEDFMSWACDDKVNGDSRWEALTSKEKALTFINKMCIPHPWRRSICIHDRSIGFVSVTPGSGEACFRAEIGYAVAARHWGHGIATEAVKMAATEVFGEWAHLVRLEALVDVQNKASQRVLEKVGFTKEGLLRKYLLLNGRLRDVCIFSLLSTDQIILHDSV